MPQRSGNTFSIGLLVFGCNPVGQGEGLKVFSLSIISSKGSFQRGRFGMFGLLSEGLGQCLVFPAHVFLSIGLFGEGPAGPPRGCNLLFSPTRYTEFDPPAPPKSFQSQCCPRANFGTWPAETFSPMIHGSWQSVRRGSQFEAYMLGNPLPLSTD